MTSEMFFVADLRAEWRRNPYVTFWRPRNAGYAYPLPWSGRYTREEIDAQPSYYASAEAGRYTRFPVPCSAVEALATDKPAAYVIDGDVGPVVPNTQANREAIRRARYLPANARRARASQGDKL